MMFDTEKKVFFFPRDPLEERILADLHLCSEQLARKAYIAPEIERLREKPLIELYEEKQQLEFLSKIYRSNLSKRAWRRNRHRHPYKKRLVYLSEAIRLSLANAKLADEQDKFTAEQNYYLENEPW